MKDFLEWINSDEYKEFTKAEDKFFEEHWANDLLDAPHALISVIETKISRAVLGREREIINLLESGEHVWQIDTKQRLFGFSWKQRCRCGFYGVFNDHLVELIRGK